MAQNPYVNRVETADGSTLMDITDTTATEDDVLTGKVFYKSSGARSTGSLGTATQSTDGLMSATDKTKLDGIAEGATANTGTITEITMNGTSMGTSGVVDLGTVATSDTCVTNTLSTTTKFYVTGTSSSSTNTGTQYFDDGIYATPTAGQMNATSFKVNEHVTLQWNTTDACLEFVFL